MRVELDMAQVQLQPTRPDVPPSLFGVEKVLRQAHLAQGLVEEVLGVGVVELDGADAAVVEQVAHHLLRAAVHLRPLRLGPQLLRLHQCCSFTDRDTVSWAVLCMDPSGRCALASAAPPVPALVAQP